MEPHWNPSVEQQALARIHRIGQEQPVTTVRYVIRNSFEEVSCSASLRRFMLTTTLQARSEGSEEQAAIGRPFHVARRRGSSCRL